MERALVATPTADRSRADRRAKQRRAVDQTATGLLWLAAILVVLMLIAFIGYLFVLGAPWITWHFLTAYPDHSGTLDAKTGAIQGGVGPEIFNSFYILAMTLIFTVPVALAAGIYLQEYERGGWFREAVQFSAESLATVPSIVMGLFGLLIFLQYFHLQFSALAGAFTLTLLNLPALMRVTQEALAGVPQTYREASMGLGATKWQTIIRSVLPSAIPAMTTGVVLISGRIFGETAALIFTAGTSVASTGAFDWNPLHPAETLAVHVWSVKTVGYSDAIPVGNASSLVLLVVVLLFNVAARVGGRYLSKALTGKSS